MDLAGHGHGPGGAGAGGSSSALPFASASASPSASAPASAVLPQAMTTSAGARTLSMQSSSTSSSGATAVQPMADAELVALVAQMRLDTSLPAAAPPARRRDHVRKESLPDSVEPPAATTAGAAEGSPAAAAAAGVDTVDLCHRRIAAVPDEVVRILHDEVVRLALGYNLLTSLPGTFASLRKLRYLNIRANLLTTFPGVITELPCLEILDISRNKIRSLPDEPGRLLHLRVLSISNNRLKRLPAYVASMRHLKILKVENNPLAWPPPHVATVPAVATADGVTPDASHQGKEHERLLIATRRRAEDRTMNAWIKGLQAWIADQAAAADKTAEAAKGYEADAAESDVISLPVTQPDAAASFLEPADADLPSQQTELREGPPLQMPVPKMPGMPTPSLSADRILSPPPPMQPAQTPDPVPPLPAAYTPSGSPSMEASAGFRAPYALALAETPRQPTLAELADSPLDEPLPPLPHPPFAGRSAAAARSNGNGNSHSQSHSRDVSSGSSASSSSQTKVSGRPSRRQRSNDAADVLSRAGSSATPQQYDKDGFPVLSRWHAHTASSDGSGDTDTAEAPSPAATRAATPTSNRKLHQLASATHLASSDSPTASASASPAALRSPSTPHNVLLPSATFRRAPSGLRKLSLPSSVAAQQAQAAATVVDTTGTPPPFSLGTATPASSSAYGTPESVISRRTPGGAGGGGGGGSGSSSASTQVPLHRGTSSNASLAQAAAAIAGNGVAKGVDSERNNYFKRLSALPVGAASKAIPLPVLQLIDATRGLLFALSQMHAALKQFILFTLDERISAQFNRILEVAGSAIASLIRALDRFDAASRKGHAEATAVRAVLIVCRDGVSTFKRVASVLQLQLKPLQQSADVRYSRTFLLMLYGMTVELYSSWQNISPHVDAVHAFLHGTEPPTERRIEPALSPIVEGSMSAGPRPMPLSALNRPQRRRHAGSFSAKDLAQGALLFASTAPAHADRFDRAELDRRALRQDSSADDDAPMVRTSAPHESEFQGHAAEASDQTLHAKRESTSTVGTPAAEVWHTPNTSLRTAPLQWQQQRQVTAPPTAIMDKLAVEPTPCDDHLLVLVDKATMTSASVWAALLGPSLDEDIAHFQSRAPAVDAAGTEADGSSTLGNKLGELRAKAMACDRLTGLLRSTLQECNAAFQRLGEAAVHEDCIARMWEEANRLVRIIVQISTLIKSITSEYSFAKELLRSLGALTTTCTELMIHMHFLSPEKMKAAASLAVAADGSAGGGGTRALAPAAAVPLLA